MVTAVNRLFSNALSPILVTVSPFIVEGITIDVAFPVKPIIVPLSNCHPSVVAGAGAGWIGVGVGTG
jgi:hypothetical protein